MILELDIGNTRAKWRLLASSDIVCARGSGDIADWSAGRLPAEWGDDVARIRVASVRSATALDALIGALRLHLHVAPEIAAVGEACAGVRNGYTLPERLGVDRWLAMIAASVEMKCAVLVVDIGSALTLDLVDAEGGHRGGHIIPGPRLMREVLTASTDRIRFDLGESRTSTAFGRDTANCVLNGATLAIAGAIQMAQGDATRLLTCEPTLVLTGGYAEEFARLPEFNTAKYRPDLVMDGLRYALP